MDFEKNCPGVVENGGVSGREQTMAARREKTMVAREGWRIPQDLVLRSRSWRTHTRLAAHPRSESLDIEKSVIRVNNLASSAGFQQRFFDGHLMRGHSITQPDQVDLRWSHQQVAFGS